MPELELVLVDESTFDEIPEPVAQGARCQTCDYWERIDGRREAPAADATDGDSRAALKSSRLLAGRQLAGAYAMLAYGTDTVTRSAVGYAQFGPISAYPRAGVIRDRYPQLPESPTPWVVTCLQVPATVAEVDARKRIAIDLLEAVCDELDRRGITAVEAYPEGVPEPWVPPPGPADAYEAAGFTRVAGDDRYPVYRRELTGAGAELEWGDLLDRARPADDDPWPPAPTTPDADDFFRLPTDKPKRPNPFGDG